MGGVIVHEGELVFTAPYALEWSILSRGAAGAREHIAELLETTTDEGMRHLLTEMNRTPALVPTDRDEVYGRAYALIREAGQGVREELLKIDYPLEDGDAEALLEDTFVQGFCDTGGGREDARKDYIGAARLFYACGALVANVVESIFPEDETESKPDFLEVVRSFRRGAFEACVEE